MTYKDTINNEYFEWMYDLACRDRFANDISYRKLLMRLHDTEFIVTHPRDNARARDGVDLRYRFSLDYRTNENVERYIDGPCSVLEMILALAIRCEESITDDSLLGDRTRQWFWGMITNIGLGSMEDSRFDRIYVDETVKRFLYREYEPNGKGGLFMITHCDYDLRDVEIWYQMCWYLNSIS